MQPDPSPPSPPSPFVALASASTSHPSPPVPLRPVMSWSRIWSRSPPVTLALPQRRWGRPRQGSCTRVFLALRHSHRGDVAAHPTALGHKKARILRMLRRPRSPGGERGPGSMRQLLHGQRLTGWPVAGSRKSFGCPCESAFLWSSEKLKRLFRLPAFSSKEKLPVRPVFQLSSMKRRIEDWSVVVWSTKLAFAYGEMTTSGRRGP